MKLSELIIKLQEINYKVTSADIETNVLSIKANFEGDWKNWSVNIHTKDEERLAEEGEELAYNCEKKGYNKAVEKACKWLNRNLSRCVECYVDDVVTTRLKEDVLEDLKKAMEELKND